MKQTIDPADVGIDPRRLSTLDSHFARYVDDGRLAGWQLAVARRGEVAHTGTYGVLDLESRAPVRADTLWRVYSMTKPITSVALMMLWEEGKLQLTDEISRWIPEFGDVRVFSKGSITVPFTVPALEPVRVWHLLTHTSGLTYGFLQSSTVDAIYRASGFDMANNAVGDSEATCRRWAELPLLFQPGSKWGYGVSTDVLGRIVEVISGQSLADFFTERIFTPLGMSDARWWVPGSDRDRLATLHVPHPATGQATRFPSLDEQAHREPAMFAGGGGLICTAADYHRFTQMLIREGELDGVRLLGSRTLRFMTGNQLPGGVDIAAIQSGGFAETTLEGVGFGLGFAVVLDPAPSKVFTTPGSYYWGGVASTAFWVDPTEELVVSFYTQLVPSSRYPIRAELRQLVYSALL